MGIEEQIREILNRELPGATVLIERDPDSGKVGGRVVWEGFAGYNSRQRHDRVFGLLGRQITTAEARDISFIFTYTPAEYADLQPA
jgi:acid stress-induced BolA-like protein IbaG/YrbA